MCEIHQKIWKSRFATFRTQISQNFRCAKKSKFLIKVLMQKCIFWHRQGPPTFLSSKSTFQCFCNSRIFGLVSYIKSYFSQCFCNSRIFGLVSYHFCWNSHTCATGFIFQPNFERSFWVVFAGSSTFCAFRRVKNCLSLARIWNISIVLIAEFLNLTGFVCDFTW